MPGKGGLGLIAGIDAIVRDQEQPSRPGYDTSPDPRSGRPEPWFVGNGRGLMVCVVTLVGALLVGRVVLTVWLAEEAWQWWRQYPSTTAAPSLQNDRVASLGPPPPVPGVDAALANASLRGNPGAAFGPDSYPAEALQRNEQGRTVARLRVGANGAVIRCVVTTSSHSVALDRRTCAIALRSIQFSPARDATGRPVESNFVLPVRWVLPEN